MSISQNQNFQFWKDTLASLKCIPSYRGTTKLSKRDDDTISQVIILNAMIVKDSVPEAGFRSLPNLKRWCLFTKALDVADLDNLQKSILLFLRNVEEEYSYSRFKHEMSVCPTLVGAFMAPLKDVLISFLKKPNASDFRHLNQFLSFMTRITLLDFDFQEEALVDYYQTETRLKNLVLNQEVVGEIREVFQDWFSDFKLQSLEPNHGPGGVAEMGRGCAFEKNKYLGHDLRTQYLLQRTGTDVDSFFFDTEQSFDRLAKVVFVPKSLSSMRTICMEPATLMFLQQACWKQVDLFMSRHPKLGKVIRLKDQEQNRHMAKIGSANRRYATIDLSAASDSVSWELVQDVFKGTDMYLVSLLTRSTRISLPDGNVITPFKFAPMGSTICFPAECLIFAAICEVVARRHKVRRQGFYSVYGDDIIIETQYSGEVVSLLESVGFLVNTSKSYWSGPFRESCGGEFFQGNEVTPVKIPRNFKGSVVTHREPGLYKMLVELSNTFYDSKFKTARAFLIRKFTVLPRHLRPLFDDGIKGLKSDQPTNFTQFVGYSRNTQSHYIEHGDVVAVSSNRTKDQDSEEALFLWFTLSTCRSKSKVAFKEPCDLISVRVETPELKLRKTRSPYTFNVTGVYPLNEALPSLT